jgi:hypothetical protein
LSNLSIFEDQNTVLSEPPGKSPSAVSASINDLPDSVEEVDVQPTFPATMNDRNIAS